MLYSLVLVDDEDWILSGIQNAIQWEALGFCVKGAFHNGKEALAYILNNQTDALLTDIKMPVMDGISLVKGIREAGFKNLEVVYLSGYDDFKLVQSSLRLGAVDYILKPSAPEQIADVFLRTRERLDEKRIRAEEKKTEMELAQAGINVFKDVICNSIASGNEVRYHKFMDLYSDYVEREKGHHFTTISLALQETVIEGKPSLSTLQRMKTLKNIVGECQDSTLKPYLISNQFLYSFVYSDCRNGQIEEIMERMNRRLRQECGACFVCVISCEYSDFRLVRQFYESSLEELFHLGMPADIRQLYLNLGNDTVLKAAVMDQDQQILLWSLKNWMLEIDRADDHFRQRLMRRLIYSLCLFFLQIGIQESTIDHLYEVLNRDNYGKTREAAISFVKSELFESLSPDSKNACLCKEAAKYISRNYTDDITLYELAKRFYISPNYLGTLFKKNIGMGIKEYQTTVRLEQADVLITSGKFKLYQVAQMVGYPNYEYFRKIYCRYRGKNPSRKHGEHLQDMLI